ncbi:MAG: UDP-3-O-(3-hydroxymyristoyl)glucosamine N-acyltransferase [Akkermansiaceae bacterium]
MELTLENLLSLVGGKLLTQGEGTHFSGLASLDEADAAEVSFLGNEKYYQDFLSTKAGAVLVPQETPESPAGVTLILVENPTFAFGEVVKFFMAQDNELTPGIDPTAVIAEGVSLDSNKVRVRAGAVIEEGCQIGDGCDIGSGCVIGANVTMGEDCHLHANATVRERCLIGSRVILQPGCVVGSDGYGYELVDGKHKKIDQVGIVVIEDDVEIGANTTIDRARFGKTLIGEGTKVDNLVQIAHNVRIGKHCLIVAQCGIAGSSQVGDYVTFAGQAGTTGHVKVEDKAVLTARSVAMKDLDGGQVYMGMPARPLRQEQKKLAALARLPKLMAEVKELKKRLDDLA